MLDICEAVKEVWQPTVENPIIFNLPATVEMTTPNVYADQIEWMSRHFTERDKIVLSIHPHNDRGCGVAASELALLAGADRIEGTLFGNGERTGNVDILNIAYNMFSQGINPELDIENVNEIIDVYERCTKMDIDPRHPYAGKLVFTAFSGSHQDAINKGLHAMEQRNSEYWEVPYLPIDPADLGREYEPIVRINSQSGKGGVAFVMDHYYGFKLPKVMHKELADEIQLLSERQGEVSPSQIMDKFREMYINAKYPLHFKKMRAEDISEFQRRAGVEDAAVEVFRMGQQGAACLGEGHLRRRAAEQCGVQLLFEAAYLVAQGGLGAVEFPRGGGEIQRPAHGEKAEKLVLVHDKKLLSGGGTSVQPQYSRK